MNPLHAAIEEFAVEGFTHVECCCPRCRVMRLRADQLAPSHPSFQHGSAVLSAAVSFTRSSRDEWKTCLESRLGVGG